MNTFDCDWVVIGSGFGGSVSALRLSEKGYKVVVIECSHRYRDEDFAKSTWNPRRYLRAPAIGLRGILRMTPFKDVFVLSGSGVGGGSLVYANTMYRALPEFFANPQYLWSRCGRVRLEFHGHGRHGSSPAATRQGDRPNDRLPARVHEDPVAVPVVPAHDHIGGHADAGQRHPVPAPQRALRASQPEHRAGRGQADPVVHSRERGGRRVAREAYRWHAPGNDHGLPLQHADDGAHTRWRRDRCECGNGGCRQRAARIRLREHDDLRRISHVRKPRGEPQPDHHGNVGARDERGPAGRRSNSADPETTVC
jgi:choline dehydrogenase-like flavoprotein